MKQVELFLIVAITGALFGGNVAAQHAEPIESDFDVRITTNDLVRPTADQLAALEAMPDVTVRWNERQGVPAVIVRHGGYLTGPDADAKEYLRSNARLLRLGDRELDDLVLTYEYTTRHNGARHLTFEQLDQGRVVHGSQIKVTLDKTGRIVFVGGSYFPGASVQDPPALSAEEAVELAAAGVRASRAEPFKAELVTFPMPGGRPARLGFKIVLETDSGWYESVIDARTSELLYRTDYASHAPEGNVFTVQNPTLGTQQIVSFAGAPFDAAGWVTDRATAGNNTNVYTDPDNDDVPDYQTQTPPSGDPDYQRFIYNFTDAYVTSGGTDVMTDRDAAITQAFYRVNWLHDYFYALGFDEPARNFQEDNFGRGGLGGDSMFVEVHNGFDVGNPDPPNTQSPPDGMHSRMELNAALVDHAMDADLVTHEFLHGVSDRLVAGQGLPFGNQTWALGEGWSDFYGTSIYDDPIAGEYVCGSPTGCPLYPYDSSPLTYSDICTLTSAGCEPHRDGEIWTATLWDLRASLMNRYGAGPGKQTTEQLVVDGMKNTISTADYLEARIGILVADIITNTAANQCAIWAAFAGRGMGVGAQTTPDQASVTESIVLPSVCEPVADAGGPYSTPEGTNALLDGSGSSPGDDVSAGEIVLFEWDLDGDGEYDDATGTTAFFTSVGQDGVFTVGLRVTNSADISDTESTTVTVINVAPTLSLNPIAPTPEGTAISLTGMATDPGWLETLTATVNWDDGAGLLPLPGVLENVRPDATLSFSQVHVYGDNATFNIGVCASDDDSTTCDAVAAVIQNVPPTAAIAPLGQDTYDGVSAYIAHAGESISVEARATDPGSDDLTLTWDWDDGSDTVATSLVNPPNPDPAKSPSVQPRDVTMSRDHTYGDACLYNLEFRSDDDDGGTSSDEAVVLIVGNATRMRGSGWWLNQYRPHPPNAFDPQTLECYLDIVVFISTVFDTALDRPDAVEILFVKKNRGSAEELFDEQLLAAWLNFANGAIGLAEPVDTDGDGVPDTDFATALLTAENVRNDPTATRPELLAQKDILERIVLRDD